MALERELAVYHEHLPAWLAEGRRGQWAFVLGGLWDIYPTRELALEAGYAFALPEGFLVKQITDEPVRSSACNVAGQQEARDAQVRAEEREACARLCEELAQDLAGQAALCDWDDVAKSNRLTHQIAACERLARLIRERKE